MIYIRKILLCCLVVSCTSQNVPNDVYELTDSKVDSRELFKQLKILSSDEFSGREIGTLGNLKARDHIVSELEKIEVSTFHSDHFVHPFIFQRVDKDLIGNNIVAMIKGVTYPDKYIVISAHYDHVGVKGKRIFNGADDNASGVSALLSFAQLINNQPLNYSVVLLFTDGEEKGLKGAREFLSQQHKLKGNFLLNINIDMISGYSNTNTLHYVSNGLNKILNKKDKDNLRLVQKNSQIKIKKGFKALGGSLLTNKGMWNKVSDHGAFHSQKIPFIYFGVGTHVNYHTSNDTYENANLSFFENATNSIYSQLVFLDNHLTLN